MNLILKDKIRIVLANPRGFCAGVSRAIKIVENALKIYGAPIYVYHEIVHNYYVVDNLHKRGVIFIEQINEVPDNSILIFSAHGVSKSVREEAQNRKITIFDATCPLVSKIHIKIARASRIGEEVILIGYAGHQEVKGAMGQYTNPEGRIYLVETLEDVFKLNVKNEMNLSFVTQTTFSISDSSNIVKALSHRFPKIAFPYKSDICYATTNRQKAVYVISKQVDVVLVVGSKNSSNSNRLVELIRNIGKIAFLIENMDDIQESWLQGVTSIGITAGASSPDILVQNIITSLQKLLDASRIIEIEGSKENIVFRIPKELDIKSF